MNKYLTVKVSNAKTQTLKVNQKFSDRKINPFLPNGNIKFVNVLLKFRFKKRMNEEHRLVGKMSYKSVKDSSLAILGYISKIFGGKRF